MAEATTLAAKRRAENGSNQARRLRRGGHIPAVIYGHKQDVISLTVENDAMRAVIRHGVRVVDLQLEGKPEKCLIREVQWDALGKDIHHVDFTRVSADERIRIAVPVHLRGTAPGVNAGGVVDQPLHELEIECLAIAVPEAIRVNIGELQLDQAIHVKQLTLPEGVKVLADPDAIVVHVVKKLEELEVAAPAEGVEGAAEPEVIGRKAAEEETEAEPEAAKKPEKKPEKK